MAVKRRYPRQWAWPNGAQIAFSVNLAFEAFIEHSQFSSSNKPGRPDPFSLSFGEYGAHAGAFRVLDLCDGYGFKGSMSTNGLAAERHPDVVRAFADEGHEVVGHGWANDRLSDPNDPEAELAEIRKCTAVLSEAAGTRPVGWTSPGSQGSKNTLGFLKQEGYLWNGDRASDDLPFVEQTAHGPMVLMPRVNTPANDLTMWLKPKNPPSIIWEQFKDTFDTLWAEGAAGCPKWIEIVIHCHIGGRPTLQPTIRRCFDYVKQHEAGVWHARKRDIAEWALKRETQKEKAAE
jgi:peptidoglycan/xylan/chitin deacetylase (PgdA/CDA1 family)